MASSSRHGHTDSASEPDAGAPELSALERALLDGFQRDFPVEPTPFATIAEQVQCTEAEVIDCFHTLLERGCISRVGAVFAPRRIGYSVLAALAVPQGQVDEVAALVSGYEEVNHNYEREHAYNLWFVVAAEDEAAVDKVLDDIEAACDLEVLRLPLERAYHIDLGFSMWS